MCYSLSPPSHTNTPHCHPHPHLHPHPFPHYPPLPHSLPPFQVLCDLALDSVAVASEDAAWYGDGLAVVDGEGMEDREGEEGDIEMDGEMTVGVDLVMNP